MKNKIYLVLLCVLISLTIVSAQTDNVVLSLKLKYDKGEITIQEMSLIEGSPPDRLNQPEKGYTAKMTSFDNKELYSFKFLIELQPLNSLDPSWFDNEGNQIIFPEEKSVEPLSELIFVLNLPHFKNAQNVEIYDESNNLKLKVDVSKYAITKEESSLLNKFFQKFAPITGSVIGIIKKPVYLFIIVITLLIAIDLFLKSRKKRKFKIESKKSKEKELESKDINIETITCHYCGNVNSSWRRYCIKCEKKLKK